jgi:hypothetical protein
MIIKMKNIYISVFSLLFIFLAGCESFVDDWDESPNSPVEATPALLLTNLEVSTFTIQTGQNARAAAVLTQQCTGTSDQMYNTFQNYNITENTINNEWQTIYENGLQPGYTLLQTYSEGYPYYQGITKILMAMNLGLATDYWGDIPYSEALRGLDGEEHYSPAFDSQENVIQTIQEMLDEAVVLLQNPASENLLRPEEDDIIFGGNTEKWIKTAYILKARYALRLTKKDETKAVSNAISYLNSAYEAGLESSEDDCNAYFDGSGNAQSQWWDFENERGGYMRMNEFFVELLKEKNDPRLPFFVQQNNNEYVGAPMGATDAANYSYVGLYYASPDATLPMITYTEAKFIESEALFRSGQLEQAAEAYNEAVISSVEKITEATVPDDYKAAEANEDESTLTLEKILIQKYIALFTQPEVWADWRRTDVPKLEPYAEATGTNNIPRRYPIAQSERLYNTKAPDQVDIVVPVWWDAD